MNTRIDSTNPKLIPGFCSLTKQEAFDISARHLLATRKPALNEVGTCTYSGTGCAAAPFIKEKYRDCVNGSWHIVADRETHLLDFVSALQLAHDTEVKDASGAWVVDERWFVFWKANMKMIAHASGLSMKVFDDAEEVW